jgi:hypothetical protein
MKRLPTLEDCPECNSQKQDTRSASVFQRLGPGQRRHEQNKSNIQREIQKVKRTSITDHAGVLMGSTGPRSGGYSGCVAWRKPRPNT